MTKVYEKLGFPGACCSIDGVHVPIDRAPASQHHLFTGKEKFPSVAWNVAVLHTREVIHVSPWVGGATNDVTQGEYDPFIHQLKMQQYEPDKTFSLYQGNGGEMTVCKGLYTP